MAKFQIVIKNSIDGELKKTVEFDEITQADAKDKSYDFFIDEVKDLADGEYTGYLYMYSNESEGWRCVNGAPVLVGEVRNGEAALTINRAFFTNR